MVLLVLLIVELLVLSFLSGTLTVSLSRVLGRRLTIALLFPGTVIHELSHLFVAEVLGVRTGKLTLMPEGLEGLGEFAGGEVQTGSVAIAQTDPIRRTTIGIAPVLVGLFAVSAISYYLTFDVSLLTFLLFYLLFSIGNSLFASREDMKGVLPVLATLVLFAAATYAAGLRFSLTGQAELISHRILTSLTQSLGLVLSLNIILLILLRILRVIMGKILHLV